MVSTVAVTDRHYERLSRDELQLALVRWLAVVPIVVVLAWLSMAVRYPSLGLLANVIGIELGLFGAYRLASRHPWLSSGVVVLLSAAATVTLAGFGGLPNAWFVLPVSLFLAGLLLSGWTAFLLSLAFGAFALLTAPLPPAELQLLCLSLLLSGLIVWLGQRLVCAELSAAWRMSAHASDLTRQIQERQAELNSAMKALQLTNHLLQSTNRELELARREADEGRRLKAEFAASISHELRTPLSIILGFTEIMTRNPKVYGDLSPFRKLTRDIAEIRRAARYLSGLVDDILDLARIDALKMPIYRERGQISEVIQDAVATVRNMVENRPVRLHCDVDAGVPAIEFDHLRIGQVILNLLTNAVRYTAQGTIGVQARPQGDDVLVSVTDTGSGIPTEELSRIFDEFHQLGAQRGSSTGKGLGLAISKRIVQLHDGRIWCESELGVGTSVYFTLPLTPRHTSRLSRRSEAGLPNDPYSPSVVLLDATPLGAVHLRRQLDGYEVHWTAAVEELTSLILEYRPHAVIDNLTQGGELSPGVQEYVPLGVPIVSMSLPSHRWLRQDERFTACLAKPVSPADLAQIAQSLSPEGRILMVDDDQAFITLMRRSFEGVVPPERLLSAYDAETALELARQERPEVVLMDIVMPGADGFALADAVRREFPGDAVRIIAVTGASLGEDALAVQSEPFTVRLQRGFRGDELAGLLRAVLGNVRASYVVREPGPASSQGTVAGQVSACATLSAS